MHIYESHYTNSWALCIGINTYKNISPLAFAVNDAIGIAKILVEEFSFPKDNVTVLVDKQATKKQILKKYLEFSEKSGIDDRIIFYFAGHGHTVTGNRGEVGYLIPYDAAQNDLSSMIRWDEMTKNSELIPAKHLLFLLDACFSGLAITRSLPSGNMRFVKDMLQRYSRQALAAGKANQPVSDGNGPVINHSVFTGHLLNGLKGEANTFKEILSANGLMHYVYQKVAHDSNSYQTPHYGFIDGDGDFILRYPDASKKNETMQDDFLFEIPSFIESVQITEGTFLQKLKTYLSSDQYLIRLDDFITDEIKKALNELNDANFPSPQGNISEEFMRETTKKFETVLSNLQTILIAVSNWGNENQKRILLKIFSRLCSHITNENAPFVWRSFRWYPIIWLMYSMGISLLIRDDYKTLYKVLSLDVYPYDVNQKDNSLLSSYSSAYSEILSQNLIKVIKEHERHFAPLSEFLFKNLQSTLEDILFIGNEYEIYFDKYEVLIGIESAYRYTKYYDRCWGPIGRYGWKYRNLYGNRNPVAKLIEIGKSQGGEWSPIKAGFFDSNPDNFNTISEKFLELLNKLDWY